MATPVPAIDTSNLFPASPTNHVIMFARMPQLSFVIQEVSLPGATVNPARVMTPGLMTRHAGDRITYDPLVITFMVDERFQAHREIHSWLIGTTGGEDRSVLVPKFLDDQVQYFWKESNPAAQFARTTTTTAGLTIVNGNKVPILRVAFYDIYPTMIGEVRFSTTTTDTITAMTSTATFEFGWYSIYDIT